MITRKDEPMSIPMVTPRTFRKSGGPGESLRKVDRSGWLLSSTDGVRLAKPETEAGQYRIMMMVMVTTMRMMLCG